MNNKFLITVSAILAAGIIAIGAALGTSPTGIAPARQQVPDNQPETPVADAPAEPQGITSAADILATLPADFYETEPWDELIQLARANKHLKDLVGENFRTVRVVKVVTVTQMDSELFGELSFLTGLHLVYEDKKVQEVGGYLDLTVVYFITNDDDALRLKDLDEKEITITGVIESIKLTGLKGDYRVTIDLSDEHVDGWNPSLPE